MIEIDDQQPDIMIDKNIESGVFVHEMSEYIDVVIVTNVLLEEHESKMGFLFLGVPHDAS